MLEAVLNILVILADGQPVLSARDIQNYSPNVVHWHLEDIEKGLKKHQIDIQALHWFCVHGNSYYKGSIIGDAA